MDLRFVMRCWFSPTHLSNQSVVWKTGGIYMAAYREIMQWLLAFEVSMSSSHHATKICIWSWNSKVWHSFLQQIECFRPIIGGVATRTHHLQWADLYPGCLWVHVEALEIRKKLSMFYSAHLVHDHFWIFSCNVHFTWECCNCADGYFPISPLKEFNYLLPFPQMHFRDMTSAHTDIPEVKSMGRKQYISEKLSKCLRDWLVQKSPLPRLSVVTMLLLLKLNCGSHTHCSTLVLYRDWQDSTGQRSCGVNLKEVAWSSLAEVNEKQPLNLLGVRWVQAKRLCNYNAMIRDPVWGGVSTRCHYMERNGFLLFISLWQ